MAYTIKSGHCKHCNERLPVQRPRPNHILHLILSILTAGLWLIVWLGVSVQFGGWRCTKCGSSSVKSVS